jgi:adenosine deaminase
VDLLRKGLCVTINSDDPAYFGGYMTDNFQAVTDAHPMTDEEVAQFTYNAIEASFIPDEKKALMRELVTDYVFHYPYDITT